MNKNETQPRRAQKPAPPKSSASSSSKRSPSIYVPDSLPFGQENVDTLLLQAGEMDEMASALASQLASSPADVKEIEIPESVPVSFLNDFEYFELVISLSLFPPICFDLFQKSGPCIFFKFA